MRLTIADSSTPDDDISVLSSWPCPARLEESLVPYVLEVSTADILKSFRGYYDDYRADGQAHPPDEDEAVALLLASNGWPSLEELMTRQPDLLEELLLDVGYDFLHGLFSGKDKGEPRYWICGVDEVSKAAGGTTLRGYAVDRDRRSAGG